MKISLIYGPLSLVIKYITNIQTNAKTMRKDSRNITTAWRLQCDAIQTRLEEKQPAYKSAGSGFISGKIRVCVRV